MILNNEERLWDEAVVTQFQALSWHIPGGTEKNHEKYNNLYAEDAI
jgi:hypothetical protein